MLQIRKRVVFKYEKCDLYVFSNTNVIFHQTARHRSALIPRNPPCTENFLGVRI